jgi:hypothetical protein
MKEVSLGAARQCSYVMRFEGVMRVCAVPITKRARFDQKMENIGLKVHAKAGQTVANQASSQAHPSNTDGMGKGEASHTLRTS